MHSPYYASPFLATLILLVVTGALASLFVRQLGISGRAENARLHAGIWITAAAPLAAWGAYGTAAVGLLGLCVHIACTFRIFGRPTRGRRWLVEGALPPALLVAGFLLAPGSEGELVLFSILLQVGSLAWRKRTTATAATATAATAATEVPSEAKDDRGFLALDVATFLVAGAAGLAIAHFVLLRLGDSGDEWAYTYQAALFAKGHAFAKVPACLSSVRMFWVFWKDDRFFAMYTPGWPLFMTPFVAIGAPWAAGPASLACLAVSIGRLARRAAFGILGERKTAIRAGGAAVFLTLMSSGVLLMGASRYPHVFVASLWAASVEFACILQDRATPGEGPRKSALPALALGFCLAWMLAARPAEGALFGGPILGCLAVLTWRRKLPPRDLAFTFLGALPVGLFCLFVLRAQLGEWFQTGYALNKVIYPWNTFERSLPSFRELKWHFPLVTGGYCWMPLTPVLGLAGLLALSRTREASMARMLGLGTVLCLMFFLTLSTGRGSDAGYSPRYQFALIVPMAVGLACVLARASARTQAMVCALGAVSLVAIWPLSMRVATEDIRNRNPAQVVAAGAGFHNAIIFLKEGTGTAPPEDAPQNLPFEYYPPDVVYAIDRGPEARACLRAQFPDKTHYLLTPDLRLADP